MTHRVWAWSVAGVTLLALGWLALPTTPEPDPEGVVRLVDREPALVPAQPAAVPARPKRIAIVATQREVDLVDDQSYRIARERRDRAWAARSEAAIAKLMRGLAYVGGARRLEITCAATLCEVIGIADPDAATNSYKPVWEALERDTAGDALRGDGLERVTAIFDTGRIPEEFKIQYRRIAPEPAS